MIGCLDYIIDDVSKKRGMDRKIVEAIAMEYFKRWKFQLTNSDCLSIDMRGLGMWIGMNSKLRGYVRENIRKIRYLEKEIETNEELSFLDKDILREKIGHYKHRIKLAWAQLDAIRYVYIRRKEVSKEKKKRRELKYGTA